MCQWQCRGLGGWLVALWSVLAAAIPASGGVYYVSTSGSDTNPGSELLPWRNVQKAASTLTAGDTVYIMQGTYAERVTALASGLEGAPITYAAYPGHSVILDGQNTGGTIFRTNNQNYLHINGLSVQNTGDWGAGFLVYGSQHVTIENSSSTNTYDSGIQVRYSSYVSLLGNEISGACAGGEESMTISLSQDVQAGYNYIHDTGHEGIDVKEGSARVRVYNNLLHDVERQALYTDAWNQPTTDIHFYNNVMYDCMFGVSIGAETGGTLSNIRVYNNLLYNMIGPGFSVQNWGDPESAHPILDVIIANNTAYNTGNVWGGGVLLENPEADGVIIRNNIFAGINDPIQIRPGERPTNLVVDHNIADNAYVLEPGWWTIAEAMFADLLNKDFHLLAGSPAIDAGAVAGSPLFDLDGNVRPFGLAPDIGAYESVPEPATLALALLAGCGMLLRRRR